MATIRKSAFVRLNQDITGRMSEQKTPRPNIQTLGLPLYEFRQQRCNCSVATTTWDAIGQTDAAATM